MKGLAAPSAPGSALLSQPGFWGPLRTHTNGGWKNFEAIHMIHMRGGYILMWQGHQFAGSGTNPAQGFIWDSNNEEFIPEKVPGQHLIPGNAFCAGHVQTYNDDVLVAGGHEDNGIGIDDVFLFSRQDLTWAHQGNMERIRWYPTMTRLRWWSYLILGGQITPSDPPNPATYAIEPELWSPSPRMMAPIPPLTVRNYPFMFTYYDPGSPEDMKLFMAGPKLQTAAQGSRFRTYILHLGGNSSPQVPEEEAWWEWFPQQNYEDMEGSGAVIWINGTHPMKRGVIYKFGGFVPNPTGGIETWPAVDLGARLDFDAGTPLWTATAPMAKPRTQQNLVFLPDGKIAAICGSRKGLRGNPDFSNAENTVEIYDPVTDTWGPLSEPGAVPRVYHSTAVLLADTSILVAGGDYENNAQIFYPPYFMDDQARPVITGLSGNHQGSPSVFDYDSTHRIHTPDAATVAKATLIGLPSTTHGFDQNQRFINLTIQSVGSDYIDVYTPKHMMLAPEGTYMLFLVSNGGMPSLAKYIRFHDPDN